MMTSQEKQNTIAHPDAIQRTKRGKELRIDLISVPSEQLTKMRQKYFSKSGKCLVVETFPDGKSHPCEHATFSNPSTDTQNKHLSKHIHLIEWSSYRLSEKISQKEKKTSFNEKVVKFFVKQRVAFSAIDSNEWIEIEKEIHKEHLVQKSLKRFSPQKRVRYKKI